ncbi:hypothetical protein DRI50_05135, partial [candidate division KSB1 bacterium]
MKNRYSLISLFVELLNGKIVICLIVELLNGEMGNRYSVYSYNRLGVIPNKTKSKRRSRESGYSEESPLV